MITLPSGRKIGEGEPPFIIAEIGSNWTSLDDCLHSIAMAKQCGADAVKFQLFDYVALYGPRYVSPSPNCMGALPKAWLPKLKHQADAIGIEFMCSAFSPELVDAVNPYVNIHKVASAELSHVRMLERLRVHGKPVILSTGASGETDIRMALDVLAGRNTQTPEANQLPVVLMYCVAAYPAQEINLDTIHLLRTHYLLPVGYSDHSTDVLEIPKRAVACGAVCVEKHFTAIDADTPDSPHSLDVDQFRLMVRAIRGGVSPRLGPSLPETAMVLRHNRRLIASRDVAMGAQLIENENFGIYRSLKDDTHAFSPFMINEVNGRVAKRAIKAGDGIGPGDI